MLPLRGANALVCPLNCKRMVTLTCCQSRHFKQLFVVDAKSILCVGMRMPSECEAHRACDQARGLPLTLKVAWHVSCSGGYP